ncbi:MAG: orotate phosphoribosyltransferase [Fimbriimonas ginsengisoli]|uniref:Orotate phosphoribosyltransferase n=1 Tax=Fimbriimonas ginsengisoli TaxID=1005039 RepID=A0A931LTC5_FIMGI|nr:orotate phosphoribosyltransferase [Fimbriimonas ginsengisoli]
MDLDALLESSGAVLRGHFLLTSGRHSDIYFEKFRVLERPDVLSALCGVVSDRFRGEVDLVAGPATGGMIIAFEVARQLGVQAVYVETEDGRKTLRRGQTLGAGARVLVVDDVLTTGTSVREVLEVVRGAGATPVGVAVLIDRSESAPDFGCPLFAAHRVEARTFAPDAVPDWLAAIPVTKPGTRPHA